jgi:hypothetical protein
MTVQVPVPLVIAKSGPSFVHAPEALYDTGNPEEAVASTGKLEPLTALAGAPVVTVIVWSVIGVRVKVAVSDLGPLIVKLHVPVPEHPPPLQPVKVEPSAGAAVRVTTALNP